MMRPPWELREKTRKDRHEESKYEPTRCDECGEKRCPPRMDLCPYCHPEADYHE